MFQDFYDMKPVKTKANNNNNNNNNNPALFIAGEIFEQFFYLQALCENHS